MIRRILIGLAAMMFVASCTTTDTVTGERSPNRTANGAIIGAILGAGAGTLAGGDDRRNALIGAGVGALAGAAIGNYMDQQEHNLRERLRGTGVGVTRVNEGQILLNFDRHWRAENLYSTNSYAPLEYLKRPRQRQCRRSHQGAGVSVLGCQHFSKLLHCYHL